MPFLWYHWLAQTVSVLFMAYAEGVRGFQLHFRRGWQLGPGIYTGIHRFIMLFLPTFSAWHATRRRKVVSQVLTAGIVVLVLAVHRVPPFWGYQLTIAGVFTLKYYPHF